MNIIWLDSDIASIECDCGKEMLVTAYSDEGEYKNVCKKCGQKYKMIPASVEKVDD